MITVPCVVWSFDVTIRTDTHVTSWVNQGLKDQEFTLQREEKIIIIALCFPQMCRYFIIACVQVVHSK